MSRNSKSTLRIEGTTIEVKSQFDAEFRRISVLREGPAYEDFYKSIEEVHGLQKVPFLITYTDPEGDLLPINNDDNFQKALSTARPGIRLCIQRKGQSLLELNGYGTVQRRNKGARFTLLKPDPRTPRSMQIGIPEDFRRVSAIIDVDLIPETHRRVKLIKSGSDKPLGFYIRDGTSLRTTPHGLEKVPGVFISRMIPGGLAEMTGLLAVNDEVLEVNSIDVAGKTLDQVTDMMVANSSNLIITVKPVNQRNNISPRNRNGSGRQSQKSTGSYVSSSAQSSVAQSYDSDDVVEETEDEIRDYSNDQAVAAAAAAATAAPVSLSKNSSRRSSKTSVSSVSARGNSKSPSPLTKEASPAPSGDSDSTAKANSNMVTL